jgi:hypothetical protein
MLLRGYRRNGSSSRALRSGCSRGLVAWRGLHGSSSWTNGVKVVRNQCSRAQRCSSVKTTARSRVGSCLDAGRRATRCLTAADVFGGGGQSRTWLQIGRNGSRIALPGMATETTRATARVGVPACRHALRRYVPLGQNWREPGLKLLYLGLPELECPGCQGRQTSMWVLHGQGWLCRALVPSRLGPFWGRFPTSRAPDW